MSSPCECAAVGEAEYVAHLPKNTLGDWIEVERGEWVTLRRCRHCDRLWSVDEFDKLHVQVAVAMASSADWSEVDTTPARKSLLLRHRGGTTQERCQWGGCSADRVRGVVFCLEHLWSVGIRI